MVGMPMRLMRLGSTGGIPKPLLFVSNINDSGEKVECCIFVLARGNIHFCCKILKILEAEIPTFPVFVILFQNVTIHGLKLLSDWMAAWRFRKSSPKHQIWSGNQQQLRSARTNFGKAGNVSFLSRKLMVLRDPNPRFSGKSIMCYVLKHK